MTKIDIYVGHVLNSLQGFTDGHFHMCVTSPPYFGLRDYGVDGVDWEPVSYCPMSGLPEISVEAWHGCLGNEPTIEMYVGHLVAVFREVHRVLRDDSVLYLNLGDSYASNQKAGNKVFGNPEFFRPGCAKTKTPARNIPVGLKQKDLVGIPWRVALALQADGWYLRSDIIWAKGISFCDTYSGACMPESVKDRPTKSHEHLFLLAKSKKYFYDIEAVKEKSNSKQEKAFHTSKKEGLVPGCGAQQREGRDRGINNGKRNIRTVWTIGTQPYTGAHFAAFPTKLVTPCIKSGTSEKGCCSVCGKQYERVMERTQGDNQEWAQDVNSTEKEEALILAGDRGGHGKLNRGSKADYYANAARNTTTGWKLDCDCGGDVVPSRVLDIFGGSGTTAVVADNLGRDCVLCEINKEYAELAVDRIAPYLKNGQDYMFKPQINIHDVAKEKDEST